jgi:hypothetical protein
MLLRYVQVAGKHRCRHPKPNIRKECKNPLFYVAESFRDMNIL